MLFIPYNRFAAVAYAHRWAYDRNPRFYDYEGIGGDCTSFASQCLYAGTGVMNYTPDFGWYYRNANDKAPSWTGVPYFYNFLTEDAIRIGPFGKETTIEEIKRGDFIQAELDGDFSFDHTLVVVERGEGSSVDEILVAAHSQNADYRPLSTYTYTKIRFLHVLGAWYHP